MFSQFKEELKENNSFESYFLNQILKHYKIDSFKSVFLVTRNCYYKGSIFEEI